MEFEKPVSKSLAPGSSVVIPHKRKRKEPNPLSVKKSKKVPKEQKVKVSGED